MNTENEVNSTPGEELPKPLGCGTEWIQNKLTRARTGSKRKRKEYDWQTELKRCVASIKKNSTSITRSEAERMSRSFQALLLPRRTPGRKPTREVVVACELRSEGVSWSEVYREVFPRFSSMPFYERSYRKANLRRAVAARLKRGLHKVTKRQRLDS